MLVGNMVEFFVQKVDRIARKRGFVISQEIILHKEEEQICTITGYLIEQLEDQELYHVPYFNICKIFHPEQERKVDNEIVLFNEPGSNFLEDLGISQKKKRGSKNEKEDWQCPDSENDLPF